MSVRVRFAPSPTGHLHVGGARTALFNWLLARKAGGTLILRIEDTDRERSADAMTRDIIEAVEWMGLDWNEGPIRQSERLDRHRAVADALLESRHAYRCFCSPEELAQRRRAGSGTPDEWKYDRRCLSLSEDAIAARTAAGRPAAVRFHVPEGSVGFTDAVFGPIRKSGEELEDFVLVRSTGQPTYLLSVVADDLDMAVSHVVRGADHIANTPKQLLLYRALGRTPPVFAHVPLILGSDRTRLSKRHGAAAVLAYRDAGILPEALVNFLALLGWSDGTDREIFDRASLVDAFSLDGISRSNAVFDGDKLSWFNGRYIHSLPPAELAVRVAPAMKSAGVWEDRFEGPDRDWLERVLALIRPRFRSLDALAAEVETYAGERVEYEPAAIEKFFNDPRLADYLPALAERLNNVERFDLESTESALRTLAGELGVRAGLLINASRVALTGQSVAPGIFDVMVMLGRAKTVGRLRVSKALLSSS